jgi:hypothetical protein
MSEDELDGSDEDKDNVLAPDDSVLTKQSFTTHVEEASITMNAVIKIIARAPVFHDETACLYTTKQKNGHEVKAPLTFSALSKDTQAFVKNLIKRLKPDYGPWFEVL